MGQAEHDVSVRTCLDKPSLYASSSLSASFSLQFAAPRRLSSHLLPLNTNSKAWKVSSGFDEVDTGFFDFCVKISPPTSVGFLKDLQIVVV